MQQGVQHSCPVAGQGGGLVGGAGHPHPSVVAEVGVVVVPPVVGGEGVAATHSTIIATSSKWVRLSSEVEKVTGEPGVEKWPKVLLLS